MRDGNNGVVRFYSPSAARRAESLALEAELSVRLIPVPRHLSSDCGLCLRFETADAKELCATLENGNVDFGAVKSI